MKSFQQLTHLFEKLHNARAEFVEPLREWFIGLSLGIAVLALGGIHAMIVYTSASARISDGVPAAETPLPYREHEVRAVLERYDERVRAFEALRGSERGVAPAGMEAKTSVVETPANDGALIAQ